MAQIEPKHPIYIVELAIYDTNRYDLGLPEKGRI